MFSNFVADKLAHLFITYSIHHVHGPSRQGARSRDEAGGGPSRHRVLADADQERPVSEH